MTEKMIIVLSNIATKKNCSTACRRNIVNTSSGITFSLASAQVYWRCVLSIYKKKSWNNCDMLDVIGHAALAGAYLSQSLISILPAVLGPCVPTLVTIPQRLFGCLVIRITTIPLIWGSRSFWLRRLQQIPW